MSKGKDQEPEDRRALPGRLSILQLSQLTGKTREHVTAKVAALTATDGTKGAKLYDSKEALAAIYERKETPQDALAIKRAAQIDLEMEITRKERPKREDIARYFIEVCANIGGIIRAAPGLSDDSRSDILAQLRDFIDGLDTI